MPYFFCDQILFIQFRVKCLFLCWLIHQIFPCRYLTSKILSIGLCTVLINFYLFFWGWGTLLKITAGFRVFTTMRDTIILFGRADSFQSQRRTCYLAYLFLRIRHLFLLDFLYEITVLEVYHFSLPNFIKDSISIRLLFFIFECLLRAEWFSICFKVAIHGLLW